MPSYFYAVEKTASAVRGAEHSATAIAWGVRTLHTLPLFALMVCVRSDSVLHIPWLACFAPALLVCAALVVVPLILAYEGVTEALFVAFVGLAVGTFALLAPLKVRVRVIVCV